VATTTAQQQHLGAMDSGHLLASMARHAERLAPSLGPKPCGSVCVWLPFSVGWLLHSVNFDLAKR